MLDATHGLTHGPARTTGPARRRAGKPVEYRIYYAIIFVWALPIALIGRLLPRRRSFLEPEGRRRGVIGEARALTNTVIPYLFMG